jgi:flagellar hook-associated protein 1
MSNFLSTGVSGLLAFQRAIDTTSQNIANVGTDGYSRQRTELATRPATMYANGWVGNGVQVTTTRRVYDDLLAQQVRGASSTFGNLDAYATLMDRVNNLFGSTTTGLTASVQKFSNALQDVANNPTSSSARQVLLSEAQGLVDRLKSYDTQLSGLDRQVESQITGETSQINALSASIADLNAQISTAYGSSGGQPPNDLLDQRDLLLDQLSSHIDITTLKQDDGQVNVSIGSGQPLVIGQAASKLVSIVDPYDSSRHGLALQLSGAAPVDVSRNVSGGTLGGAMSFRDEVLDPTRNALGRISVALTDAVNQQHRAGIDLSGALGGDLFSIGAVDTLAHSGNAGTGTLAVTRSDVSALTTGDYILQKTATGWSLADAATGAAVTLSGTGVPGDPLIGDGLSIVTGGIAQTGDRFLIRPTRSAASGLGVLITNPGKIAAAAPIRAEAATANTGGATISPGSVVDATDAQLRSTTVIAFLDATTYSVNGAGAFAYTSGAPISINGWQVQITGTPATGDTFTISDNTGGTGDNRNALALSDSLGRPVLDNGTTSINDSTSRLVGSIGVATQQVKASRDAQNVIRQESVASRDSVSGVNLDEEAANLLKYQQAYQAAAQLISVASTLFDSLLAATRG